MNNLEVLQLHISKPFEPLYPAAVLEWASKEARKDNESRPTSGLGFFKDKIKAMKYYIALDKIAWWSDRPASRLDLSNQSVGHLVFIFPSVFSIKKYLIHQIWGVKPIYFLFYCF